MHQTINIHNKRIESIDLLRGIAMIIMALDHVRDFFHIEAFTGDPLNLETTTPILYFTRWITHFCAPTFVFLSGTSIYLQSLRKSKSALSVFLIKRGFWLVFVEFAIISLAFSFNIQYNFIFLQVIWAIGISMVILGLLIWLPYHFILIVGLLIVLGHNLLDFVEASPNFKPNFWWELFHSGYFSVYPYAPGHAIIILYPFVAWTGLMVLGYCAGVFYSPQFSVEQRKKYLIRWGVGLIVLFVLLRYSNLYGNPSDWKVQKSYFYTLLSFLDVNKYPPSLLYMCMTIGPLLLLLAWVENIRSSFFKMSIIFGRTAFFYYILHFYLIHALATVSFYARGHSMQELAEKNIQLPFNFLMPGDGYNLWGVYLIWIFVLVVLYPFCAWYDRYKSNHRTQWWLSYL